MSAKLRCSRACRRRGIPRSDLPRRDLRTLFGECLEVLARVVDVAGHRSFREELVRDVAEEPHRELVVEIGDELRARTIRFVPHDKAGAPASWRGTLRLNQAARLGVLDLPMDLERPADDLGDRGVRGAGSVEGPADILDRDRGCVPLRHPVWVAPQSPDGVRRSINVVLVMDVAHGLPSPRRTDGTAGSRTSVGPDALTMTPIGCRWMAADPCPYFPPADKPIRCVPCRHQGARAGSPGPLRFARSTVGLLDRELDQPVDGS